MKGKKCLYRVVLGPEHVPEQVLHGLEGFSVSVSLVILFVKKKVYWDCPYDTFALEAAQALGRPKASREPYEPLLGRWSRRLDNN